MSKKNNRFKRRSNVRDVRPLFIIATEGKKTEPDYFNIPSFKPPETAVIVRILPTRTSSSPISVLKRMQKYIKDNEIDERRDNAWLVIDLDSWEEAHIDLLFEWCKEKPNRHLIVSNPMFEYWLLLHFENGDNITSNDNCVERLKKYLPGYSKSKLDVKKFTIDRITLAVERAKIKDEPPCEKWPMDFGSTVYRLIEKLWQH